MAYWHWFIEKWRYTFVSCSKGWLNIELILSRFERTPDDLLPLLWPGEARASGEYTHTSFRPTFLPKGLVRSLAGRFPWQPNPHPFLTQAGGEQQSVDGLCSFNLVLCISLWVNGYVLQKKDCLLYTTIFLEHNITLTLIVSHNFHLALSPTTVLLACWYM